MTKLLLQSEAVIEEITEGYLNYVHITFLVPMHEHVYECIQAGLTTLDGMDNDLFMKVVYHLHHLQSLMGQLL